MSPRRREYPDASALERLVKAGKAREAAETELRAAVLAAAQAGGSVRVIAQYANISTRTVQNWLGETTPDSG